MMFLHSKSCLRRSWRAPTLSAHHSRHTKRTIRSSLSVCCIYLRYLLLFEHNIKANILKRPTKHRQGRIKRSLADKRLNVSILRSIAQVCTQMRHWNETGYIPITSLLLSVVFSGVEYFSTIPHLSVSICRGRVILSRFVSTSATHF